ncbi:MAG: replication-relaxation family protein [Chloroflexota bacterium]
MTLAFRGATPALALDPQQLPLRDRAVLRILNRARLANAEQLGILVYRNRHYAQIRLRRLFDLGYLERAGLPPPAGLGGAPFVYRLAPAAIARLGYAPRRWRGPGYVAHTLDAVEAVCALVRSTDPDRYPTVLRWLPESIVADVLPAGPAADAVIVIAADDGPATVCLEIDEGNQHVAPIGAKLHAYRAALEIRPGWHVLFVVPTPDRAAWLRRAAHGTGDMTAWVTTLDELRGRGPDARLASLSRQAPPQVLRRLAPGPAPLAGPPVGSRRWLEILGSGGAEAAR